MNRDLSAIYDRSIDELEKEWETARAVGAVTGAAFIVDCMAERYADELEAIGGSLEDNLSELEDMAFNGLT